MQIPSLCTGQQEDKKCVMSSQSKMIITQKEIEEIILYKLYWNVFTVPLLQTSFYNSEMLNKRMGIITLAQIPLYWCLLSLAWKLMEESCLHHLWREDKAYDLLTHRNRFLKMSFAIF